jgi:translation initiation factor 2B subunit (eIF-2B alpha/beta/delta family)
MASDARLLGLAEGWLMRVNHMTLAELSERLIHGEVESLASLLREVRDEAQGRDVRLLEEALERGRETLHKAIAERADMQAMLANVGRNVAVWLRRSGYSDLAAAVENGEHLKVVAEKSGA